MNESDSEKIAAVLKMRGHKPAKNENEANLIVINACSVRQSAVDRVFNKINKYYQNKRSPKKIILAGCVLETDKNKLKDKVSEFWSPDQYFELASLAKENSSANRQKNKQGENNKLSPFTKALCRLQTVRNNKHTAFVPIMTGCNNFCAYCVVPFTRGREKSRPAEEIIEETRLLIKKGYKEIVLLGQNVNSYKGQMNVLKKQKKSEGANFCSAKITDRQKPETINFSQLLKLINRLSGNFWLSFLTSHPKDMSDELIKTIAQCQKVTPYIHLPVQSGDNEILRKMNRRYTISHYKNLIKKIRDAFAQYRPKFPPVAISTDIIVGFPGETKKQFENSAKLMRQIKFDMAYIAKYSPRPGTAAARLKDNVLPKEKQRRWNVLHKILTQTALANNRKYLGKTIEVLFPLSAKTTGKNFSGDFIIGKTPTNKKVKFFCVSKQRNKKPQQFAKVKIEKAASWGLFGKLIDR